MSANYDTSGRVGEQTRRETWSETRDGIAVPRLYAVLLHNDDYTPMDFVVELLVAVFHKTADEAERVMMSVHNEGAGVAGVYSFDIAVTKKGESERLAQSGGHPLRLSLREEGDYDDGGLNGGSSGGFR